MHSFVLMLAVRTGLFAEGRFLGRVVDEWAVDAQEFIRVKLPHLLVVAVIAFVLMRLLHLITYSMTRAAERHSSTPAHIAQVKTVAGIVRTTGLAIIWLIAGLQILDALGVNLAPLLASAGIAGIALGLAAQNIVKDVLNGILILVEDQFNVGDTVRLAGVAGTVEAMTLRETTVRDADGSLYIIPNSQITTVANLSVGYSVATVNVSVDFSANPDKVLELLKRIATELIFPVVFKTLATKQYAPVREFRRRVRLALEEQHLLPGDPNRVFNTFMDRTANSRPATEASPGTDPTTLKPQGVNPFSSE